MKKLLIVLVAFFSLFSCSNDNEERRLVVITIDGLRWQELFTGADSFLVGDARYVVSPDSLKQTYWRATPEERREVLMPFTWSYVVKNGFLIGNRDKGSQMQVANKWHFSYPGYSELFVGYPDDERVNSNDLDDNPNTSVFEVVNRDERYRDSVMVYGTWGAIPHIVNSERGGIKGGSPENRRRGDDFTYEYAIEMLTQSHPKVLYVSFGGTDHFGHIGKYDMYLDAAHKFDEYIKGIVETCEADPFYKGRTAYIVTTDHGRGFRRAFISHGVGIRGSENTWLMAFGRGMECLGETSNNGPYYSQQVAATIAKVMGVDFTPDNGVKQQPRDPHFKGEAIVEEAGLADVGNFPAIEATPTGKGVKYAYYEGSFHCVGDIKPEMLKSEGIIPNFDITKAQREDGFGFVFKALIDIPETGRYMFTNISDDGSCVWLDGKQIINDDGSHSTNYTEVYAEMEKGLHRLEIKYIEDCEGQTYGLELEGPGVPAAIVPDAMLYYE
jgi:hypothetical protein